MWVTRDDETPCAGAEGEWDDPLAQMIDSVPHWILAAGATGVTQHPNLVIGNKTFFNKLAEICHDLVGPTSNLSCMPGMDVEPTLCWSTTTWDQTTLTIWWHEPNKN